MGKEMERKIDKKERKDRFKEESRTRKPEMAFFFESTTAS
jgi:hypothetical protein